MTDIANNSNLVVHVWRGEARDDDDKLRLEFQYGPPENSFFFDITGVSFKHLLTLLAECYNEPADSYSQFHFDLDLLESEVE